MFRDQQFSEEETSASAKRIDDVAVLRAAQWPEDAGPMAHPIRPESVAVQDNFYTSTVYNKGAEVPLPPPSLLSPPPHSHTPPATAAAASAPAHAASVPRR